MPDPTLHLLQEEEGCDWIGCRGRFYAAYNDVTVIPEHTGQARAVGRIALCHRHYRVFREQRRLELDWDRVR